MTDAATPAPLYTEHEASDEALLLLIRKLRKAAPDALTTVMAKLPQGAIDALGVAERRADAVRYADEAAGIAIGSRTFPDPFAAADEDADDEDESA